MRKGRILKLIGGWYTLEDLETKETFNAKASGKLRHVRLEEDSSFLKQETKRTKKEVTVTQLSPKVGDLVYYDDNDENKPIQEILPRRNELSRPDVANIDQILLIFSTVEPSFNFLLLDQFLVLIEKANIKPIIVISKIDLIKENELTKLKEKLKYYKKIGYQLYYINSHQKIGLDVLETIFLEKVSVVAGQTGVGKSTLINALVPYLHLRTQEISKALGRGRHTTRHTELFYYRGGLIADTPGFSKLELNIFEKEELKDYFIEFNEYSENCRFKNKCYHIHEPGCNVKENETILKSRIENYQKMFLEIENLKEKY